MATTSIAITRAAYIEAAAIGAIGRITNPNEDDVYVFLNPTIPSPTDIGHLLVGISEDNTEFFLLSGNATDKAWVRFADNSLNTVGSVIVSLGDAGAGATTATVAGEAANKAATILASAARTATVSSADQTNLEYRGAQFIIDVTAITATPSVVFTIEGKDALSGIYYPLLVSVAITATGTTILRVYPDLNASPNSVASDILPVTWRITATHADADSITYSVGVNYVR
jgi:hypothetical protein